jgi:cell division protease FtsH
MSAASPSSGSGPPRGPDTDDPKRGWRLPPRPLGRVGKWVAVGIIAAFVLNYWIASRQLSEPLRIHIPYSPLFLDQVRAGNVDRITSKGTSLQGMFKKPVRYPATGPGSRSSERFSTLIPSFADTAALSQLLEEENVTINAEPLDTGAPW